ncbi:MAG: signal peptide peptidase SppA [Acidobacteria bacterium]|nr:signal peptide peptidase SppA [Acidobacteriota bacterium]
MYDEERRKSGGLGCLFRGIDVTRRVILNVIFWALVIAVIVLLLRDTTPDVPDSAALVISPQGDVVEQLAGDPVERLQEQLTGGGGPETLLKDLEDSILAARDDERIKALLLDLDSMGSIGLSKLQDLRVALREFKKSGKPVIAAADTYDQNRYYLAAMADEIYLHEMGMLLLEGFSRYRMYYKEGLGKLMVDVHVFKVGTFKSAVEPYLRQDMSEEAKTANKEWLGDLWRRYLEDVAESRKVSVAALQEYIEGYPDNLSRAEGDAAKMALSAGLVDHVVSRDAIRRRMIELVGKDEKTHSFQQIGHDSYLQALDKDRFGAEAEGDLVGVVVAVGNILGGSQPPGKIGGDSTAALIRQARENENVKAVVLRVDSGGGSAFASEVIRRELELTRQAGKPVVASMGTVAASGGYWITMASDEVWAAPTTITGSIGIFGMFPTYDRGLKEYLGISVDGIGTTPYAGAMRPDRPLDDRVGQLIQQTINKGYRDFITKVGQARNMTSEEVDRIAQGRVWSGEDAHELGLVDNMGSLQDAIAAAAKLAKLGDEYKVKYMEREVSFREKILRDIFSGMVQVLGKHPSLQSALPPPLSTMRLLAEQAAKIAELNDPQHMYAYFPYEE